MKNTRVSSSTVLLSVVVAAVSLLALGFAAWRNFSGPSFDVGGLTSPRTSQPQAVNRGTGAEGLAIYRQSEQGIAPRGSQAAGLAIYHKSERGIAPRFAQGEGLAIYRKSEQGAAPLPAQAGAMSIYHQSEWESIPVDQVVASGLAIYQASERNSNSPASVLSADEGMALYHASEWSR